MIRLNILKTDTYSEMWTKISLPPSDGVMKPWPLEREKYLHTPVNTGPCDALAVLRRTTTEKTSSMDKKKTENRWAAQKMLFLGSCLSCEGSWDMLQASYAIKV